jgi:hypothetical protein
LIPDGYELIGDEYVRTIPLLLEKEIEKHVEINIDSFFKKIGYDIKKIPTAATRTVDYEYEDLGIEVTLIREYLSRNDDTDNLLRQNAQGNSRICAYMYLKDDKPKIEILDERKLDNNISILCLRQHISCYRPKLISKINNKYSQDKDHPGNIIIFDFRLAHFDSLSVKREIKAILTDKGMEFPSLGGILAFTPKHIDSDMLDDDPDYVFIDNPYCNISHEILRKLSNYSMATTSYWITVDLNFIKKPRDVLKISLLCSECPDRDEIQRRGLSTFE